MTCHGKPKVPMVLHGIAMVEGYGTAIFVRMSPLEFKTVRFRAMAKGKEHKQINKMFTPA